MEGVKFTPGAIYTLADLQHIEFPPIKWVWPDILPEGLTILAGKPKLGKSWLSLDLAIAVASNGNCLGRQCDQGAVLVLALEDNQRRMQRRVRAMNRVGDWPEAAHVVHDWRRLDAGGEDDLRTWLQQHPDTRLIVVDTLGLIRPAARSSESAHANDYSALRGLHQIAGEHGIGILVIHHLRKADADDPFDSVSGSTGLTGAADTTLILTKRQEDGGVVLYGRGRDLPEIERGLEFDSAVCRWRDLGDPVEAFASDTRAAIFAATRSVSTQRGQSAIAATPCGLRSKAMPLARRVSV